MGGAGFPAGRKWDLVAAQDATPKYVICNADESEPGTFKDREILATQPHLVLEGMLLGMLAVGAEEGWVFIRHEYGPEEQVIRREIEHLRDAGLIGPDAGGTGRRLNVEVFTSPGGYILGEESALIECMEGHRGEPRNKPPFPGTYGLHGKPTLMNSVETFAHVPVIALRGADWWKAQGRPGKNGDEHAGLKFFAVSGHVERPGVYCVPMGTTARELLDLAGGVSGGRAARRHPAGRRLLQLHRPRPAGRGARLRHAAGGRVHARLRRDRRHGRGHRPARRRRQRAAVLPRRVLRQVRAVPGRLDEVARHPHRPARRGRRSRRTSAPTSASCRGHAPHLDLRPRPGRARPGDERKLRASGDGMPAETRPTDTGASGSARLTRGREFFTTRTVAEALAGFRPARRTPAETVPLGRALRRVTAEPVTAPHPLPGFARSTVDGYAVRAADTYGVSEGLPGYLTVTGAVRMGAEPDDGVSPRARRSRCRPAARSRPARTRS